MLIGSLIERLKMTVANTVEATKAMEVSYAVEMQQLEVILRFALFSAAMRN